MKRNHLNTECIVLKRINYKDADKVLTLYTKDVGKTAAIAKGIRKISSRKKSHLELFNHSKVYLVKGKNWFIVTQAETIENFETLKSYLRTTQSTYYISEIMDKLTPEGEPNDALFRLLLNTLRAIDKHPNISIINYFNLYLLKLSGYFSLGAIKSIDVKAQSYVKLLINAKLQKVPSLVFENETEKHVHKWLKAYTEEILEREIKTKILEET